MPVKVGLKHIEIWNDSMEKYVQKYEEENAAALQDQIVFYGPSNFTRWSERWGMTPLREAVVGKSGAPCCVNRGFGSSCPEHQLYYYDRLVRPLTPRVLVYSPGFGNGRAFGYSLEESWELAQRVIAYASADFPEIRILLCGSQPRKLPSEEQIANARLWDSWLKEFAEATESCRFVDVSACAALGDPELFVKDGVHYNERGYARYADFFREVLKDELARY